MVSTALRTRPATAAEPHRSDLGELTLAAAAGDQAAWNELVERFSGLVWGITRQYRLCPTDAADTFQTTWLRLVERIDSLSEPRGVGAWLATTTRRECLRVLRVTGRQIPVGDALPEPDDEIDIDAELLRIERDVTLRKAFDSLRQADRDLLRLLIADPPVSYNEIAAQLNIPRGSIGPTRGRCLERLRRACDLNG